MIHIRYEKLLFAVRLQKKLANFFMNHRQYLKYEMEQFNKLNYKLGMNTITDEQLKKIALKKAKDVIGMIPVVGPNLISKIDFLENRSISIYNPVVEKPKRLTKRI